MVYLQIEKIKNIFMKFQPIVPMIWTKELNETVDFYCDVLGFTCGNYNEDWGCTK